jgi:hypothetical protein
MNPVSVPAHIDIVRDQSPRTTTWILWCIAPISSSIAMRECWDQRDVALPRAFTARVLPFSEDFLPVANERGKQVADEMARAEPTCCS